jgi:hypothetical protein
MARYKPEIILLRNGDRQVPFQSLLENEYRLIYQDEELRLYAQQAVLERANSAGSSSMVKTL